MDLEDIWPNWGSTGSKPEDGKQFEGGDNPKAPHFNYLWFRLRESFVLIEDWITSVEEGDISVSEAEHADTATHAEEANKLDGETSDYYATDANLSTLESDHSSLTEDVNEHKNEKLSHRNIYIVDDIDDDPTENDGDILIVHE